MEMASFNELAGPEADPEAVTYLPIAHLPVISGMVRRGQLEMTGDLFPTKKRQIIRATNGILRSSTTVIQLSDSVPTKTMANFAKGDHGWS